MNTTEVITVTDEFILLSIMAPDEHPLSWEQLQSIKERIFPGITFVEIYPSSHKVVNNANQRHLYHIRGMKLPCLSDLEMVGNYSTYQ
jgi:hypothetical protein